MAANHVLIPTISLILLFLSPLTTANSPVIDIDGNPLEAGSRYYVLTSGTRGAGRGGLTAASKDRLCPLYVGQYRWWNENGSPVVIIPNNTTQNEITVGTDVSFAFGGNQCRNFGVWRINFSPLARAFFVTNDGTAGEFTSTFKIEETSGGPGSYKIVYCFATAVPPILPPPPPQPEYCEQLDSTVPALFNDLSWLSLVPIENSLPFFGFTFKKVEEGSTSTQ